MMHVYATTRAEDVVCRSGIEPVIYQHVITLKMPGSATATTDPGMRQ